MKRIFLLLILALICTRCAQVVSPTGGKKDDIPPKLISSNPENKSVNFKGNVISLTFDEYVAVDNLMQKLIITPEGENPYTPQVKNQTVILKFRKPFADSTTYTFNFADGIKDISERNPAQNLKLVFSTGPVLDSGRVYGTVKDIRTNKPVFDALVGLYQMSDTLDPQKNKPYYFSRTDSSGFFAIENAQIADYSLIAITDKNRNLLYNPKDESIAYLDSIIKISSDTSAYELTSFHSDLTPLRIQRTIPKVHDYTLVFNKGIEKYEIKFQSEPPLKYILESPTQLKFFNVPTQSDTTRAQIVLTDSLGYETTIDQKIMFLPPRGKEKASTTFTAKPNITTQDPVDKEFNLELQLTKPVSAFDSTLVTLVADSANNIPTLRFSWSSDSTLLSIAAQTSAKDSLVLQMAKGAVISIEQDTLPAIRNKYAILNPADYGIIRGTVANPSGKPFFVELVDKEFKNVLKVVHTTPFVINNIKPGSYYLRLIIDENRNGRWDTGDYSRKKQPESVIIYPKELLIKSNFEYEEEYFHIP